MYILGGLAVLAVLIGVVVIGYGRARSRGDDGVAGSLAGDSPQRVSATNVDPDMPSDTRHETEQADYGA